eukprot:gene194-203_t
MALFSDRERNSLSPEKATSELESILKDHLSWIYSTFQRVQYPAILTIHGDVLASLEKSAITSEYISHVLSVFNLSKELLVKLRGGDSGGGGSGGGRVNGLKVRGVNETVLCLYQLTDYFLLVFYCLKPSDHFVVYEPKDIDNELQPVLEDLRNVLTKTVVVQTATT